MSWITDLADPAVLSRRARKSLALQIGLANPLWLAFGAAATTGAAWWLMTRATRPVNVEAASARPGARLIAPSTPEHPAITDLPEAVHADFAPVGARIVETERQAPADDLTRLVGVGPRTAAAFAERGVTRFATLAAWSAEDLAAFDAEMNLKGRSLRDRWLEQAGKLAADA